MLLSGCNILDVQGNVQVSGANILDISSNGGSVMITYLEPVTRTIRVINRYLGASNITYAQPYVNLTSSGCTFVNG